MSRQLRLSLDRLSSLPDEVVEHILSYLPTKDAVATSFLSKRWKSQSLWRSQFNLHFNDIHFPDSFAFHQFFYFVITNRDKTQPIISFHLNSRRHGFYHESDFFNALYAATTQGVQNLTIDLCYRPLPVYIMTLPTFVLTTKTLSVLKLKRVKITFINDLVVDLPSLKLLHLESVHFKYNQYFIKLLSGCPILEEFEEKDLILKFPLIPNRSDALSLSNLVRANISSSPIIQLDWLSNVHHLRIQVSRRYFLDGRLMFHNLTYMELAFKLPDPPGLWKWNQTTKHLQNSAKLQTLIIDEINVDVICNCNGGEWRKPKTVPECLSSHLTTCTIRNYSCFNCGFQFAKYIMQNSRVLSTMTIQSSKSVDLDTKLQMLKELSLCPMISPTCKLLFS